MSKIFKATDASTYINEGVYTMYRLAGKDLGAKNFTTVMYDYEPNWRARALDPDVTYDEDGKVVE